MDEKPKVAIYVRVSTKGQELDNQIILLKDFSKRSKWDIHNIYCDVVTGRDESRPEFDRLFKDAHKKLFDILLFWSLDRFARSGMTFTVIKLNELTILGIMYHSYEEPLLNTDNELSRNIVLAAMSSLAKIESERISNRTKLAFTKDEHNRTIARRSGKRVGRNEIPVETIEAVKQCLENKMSYRTIHNVITYKTKFGKIHKISIGKISKIANSVQKTGVENNSWKKV